MQRHWPVLGITLTQVSILKLILLSCGCIRSFPKSQRFHLQARNFLCPGKCNYGTLPCELINSEHFMQRLKTKTTIVLENVISVSRLSWRLTTLHASTACYRDSINVVFYISQYVLINIKTLVSTKSPATDTSERVSHISY
jgi:hypothetical protein